MKKGHLLKVAVIGLGYWGPNLVRNFLQNACVGTVIGCDRDANRIARIKRDYPSVEVISQSQAIIKRKDIDVVVIATPVKTHFKLASDALKSGKHVLVEKPMATSRKECETLLALARKYNRVLMVDHTFIYTGSVRKMKSIIDSKEIGKLFYFDSVRINLGLFQHDVDVIWDLAPHDLSVMDYLIKNKPLAISADAVSHFDRMPNLAYIHVHCEQNFSAHFHVNWLAPVKVRRILIGGSKKMIDYNDIEPNEKVKVYDKGVDIKSQAGIHKALIQYRMGDMYAPKIDQTEALTLLVDDFIQAINKKNKKIIADAESAMRVVSMIELIQQSIKKKGTPIKFRY